MTKTYKLSLVFTTNCVLIIDVKQIKQKLVYFFRYSKPYTCVFLILIHI